MNLNFSTSFFRIGSLKKLAATQTRLWIGLSLTLLYYTASFSQATAQVTPESVDALIAHDIADGIPGVSVFVANDEIEVVAAAGLENIKQNIPLTTNSLVRLASITKPFTYAVITQMIEEGKFTRNTLVSQLLDQETLKQIGNADSATVAHLLEHESGIVNFTDLSTYSEASWRDPESRKSTLSPLQLLDLTRGLPARFSVGERFDYSNTNYILLGLIATQQDGLSLGKVFSKRIFQPLGMTNTIFEGEQPSDRKIARSYMSDSFEDAIARGTVYELQPRYTDKNLVEISESNPANYNAWAWAAGAISSNASDLAKFLSAVTRGEFTIMSPRQTKLLMDGVRGYDFNGGSWGIAASCYVNKVNGVRVVVLYNGWVKGWDRYRTFNALIGMARKRS